MQQTSISSEPFPIHVEIVHDPREAALSGVSRFEKQSTLSWDEKVVVAGNRGGNRRIRSKYIIYMREILKKKRENFNKESKVL